MLLPYCKLQTCTLKQGTPIFWPRYESVTVKLDLRTAAVSWVGAVKLDLVSTAVIWIATVKLDMIATSAS